MEDHRRMALLMGVDENPEADHFLPSLPSLPSLAATVDADTSCCLPFHHAVRSTSRVRGWRS